MQGKRSGQSVSTELSFKIGNDAKIASLTLGQDEGLKNLFVLIMIIQLKVVHHRLSCITLKTEDQRAPRRGTKTRDR